VDGGSLLALLGPTAALWLVGPCGKRAVASFCAAVWTGICLGKACSCHEILRARRPGSGLAPSCRWLVLAMSHALLSFVLLRTLVDVCLATLDQHRAACERIDIFTR
jgi:hypothetical protein